MAGTGIQMPNDDFFEDDERLEMVQAAFANNSVGMTQRHFIESNRIEGVTDLGEVPKSIIAWNYLTQQQEIRQKEILDVHWYLMDGLMAARDVGVWRKCNVMVGSSACPHFIQIPELISAFISDLNHSALFNNITTKSMHIRFEHIHPFRDGNGRTGRMLMWWHQVMVGEQPTLITYDDRFSYYDWF